MKFLVDLTLSDESKRLGDPDFLADRLLDFLCDSDEPWFDSCDAVEAVSEPEPFRDRAADPRLGDQTACKHCGHDIEYMGDTAPDDDRGPWWDRGAGSTCLPHDWWDPDIGGMTTVIPPEDQQHEPVSDQ